MFPLIGVVFSCGDGLVVGASANSPVHNMGWIWFTGVTVKEVVLCGLLKH